MRDSQRAKVYAAEDFVRTLFDRTDGRGSLDFFGTALTLPPEARFGSVDAVRRYVEDVLALPAVRQRWPAAGACAVRARRGATAAHYEPGVIAVPDRQSTWALRELVVFFGHFAAIYRTIPAKGSQRARWKEDSCAGACPVTAAAAGTHREGCSPQRLPW
ncbi:TIGR04338 family metallohydrolase [Mycolicibacterium bacteremicum]|uniref:TIGR04338 family metallohydrolase n=1 Tax=Mycolicibacterium bacteremicum TaxID=564198 RepID=UPI001F40AAB7|nr:TIGR04338 family metallohydrolase [Mycolicibacterium bacteremicum]